MRVQNLVVSVLGIVLLSACSHTSWEAGGTPPGDAPRAQAQTRLESPPDHDGPDLAQGIARLADSLPGGYTGHNRRGVILKPPGLVEARPLAAPPAPAMPIPPVPLDAGDSGAVTWNDLGDLDAYTHDAPATAGPAPTGGAPLRYNKNVQVFPLDGGGYDAAAYESGMSSTVTSALSGWYGEMAARIFFAHGSARLGPADREKLRGLARDARGDDVSVTVVGHASKRVDGVGDPVKRRMINFEMAQKRAQAVAQELKQAGMDPAWVRAYSKGDEEPNPAPPAGMKQEAADRRVEVYVDGQ